MIELSYLFLSQPLLGIVSLLLGKLLQRVVKVVIIVVAGGMGEVHVGQHRHLGTAGIC